jgi:hypothetical protein
MRVAGIVLPGHRRKRIAQMRSPIAGKAAGIMSARSRVVVKGAVVAVAGYAALLLQLHQGLDLMMVRLGV